MFKHEVLATVAGKDITLKDLELLISGLDQKTALQFKSEDGRKKLLDELVNQELFYLDAIDNKVEKDEEYLAEVEKLKANFLKQYAIYKLMKSATIQEDEILSYFSQNKPKFQNPERIKAVHILVDSEDKAKEIIHKIETNELSFEKAAMEYSKCPSKNSGGDLGYFTRGRMVPEFETAAFNMEIDEISKPVKTSFGYHIIKVIDKKEGNPVSYDNIKDELSQQLLAEKQQDIYFKKVNELKGKYEVKINL